MNPSVRVGFAWGEEIEMKKTIIALMLSFVAVSWVTFAEASCGSSNCTLIRGSQSGVVNKGRFVIDLSYRYILQDKKRKGSNSFSGGNVDVAKVEFETGSIEEAHHREFKTINKLIQLDVSYGLTEKFTFTVNIPMVNDRQHEHLDGLPAAPKFTNQDGTSGFGDVTIVGKYALFQTTKHLFIVGAGIKLASGEFKLLNSEGEINEPTIMPGTGSNDPVISTLYNYSLIPNLWNLFASVSHRFTTENSLKYEFGDTTLIDAGVSYKVNEKITLVTQLNTRVSRRDMFIDSCSRRALLFAR